MTTFDLFGATPGPAASVSDGSTEYTLAVEWSLLAGPRWLAGYRFWRAPDGGTPEVDGPISARTWEVVGTSAVPSSDATFVLSGSGWQEVLLATPQPLTVGTRYRSGLHFPNGWFVATADYWSVGPGAAGITVGALHGHSNASASSNQQGSLNVGPVLTFPAAGSGSAANYWVTPIITDVDPAEPDPSGSVDSVLALSTTTAGEKQIVAVTGSGIALTTVVDGQKHVASARTSPLTLGGAAAGESLRGSSRTSTLTLVSSSTGGPVTGPIPAVVSPVLCAAWATPADVPAEIRTELGITDQQLATQLMRASELLWMLTGRIWYGIGCSEEVTLRSLPTSAPWRGDWIIHSSWGECPCWLTPGSVVDHIAQPLRVKLPRSPVQAITSVTVEGVLLDPSAYRLNHAGVLERIDGGLWQVCGGDTVIVYTYGEAPPAGGRDAAVTLGIEFARDFHGIAGCRLPSNVTSLTRQEVTTTYADPNEFLEKGLTGLRSVDLWVRAINPHSRPQRARVYSPDVPRTNRRSLP